MNPIRIIGTKGIPYRRTPIRVEDPVNQENTGYSFVGLLDCKKYHITCYEKIAGKDIPNPSNISRRNDSVFSTKEIKK